MVHARGSGVAVTLAILTIGGGALAAPTAGRVRLSLEGQLVGYEQVSVDSASASTTSGGLAGPSLGVGVGGGIGENAVLGARASFVTQSNSQAGSDSTSTTQFMLVALPAYVFNGDSVRPFI